MFETMDIDYIDWIRSALKETGKTQIGLAKHLGVAHPQITRLLNGTRRLKVDELPKIAAYLGRPIPTQETNTPTKPGTEGLTPIDATFTQIPIRGEVAAGLWREVDELSQELWSENEQHQLEYAPAMVLPGYPREQQFGLYVRGESLNKIAPDGAILHCLEFINGDAWHVKDSELVIVQRSKYQGAMIETTAKRVKKNGDIFELWPESTDPDFQEPLIVPETHNVDSTEEVRIFAKVMMILIKP